jgi:predicted transcriptional regulator
MRAGTRAHDTTIRIDERTSSTLSRLAKERGSAKKEIIAQAVERMRRDEMLEALNVGYAALKADSGAWREEVQESELWESTTLADGLSED